MGTARIIVGVLAMVFLPMLAIGADPPPTSTSSLVIHGVNSGVNNGVNEGVLPAMSVDDWINLALVIGGPLVVLGLWLGNIIRPGSLKSGGIRGVASHPTWVWLMAAVVTIIFAQAARSGSGELLGLFKIGAGDERGKALLTLGYIVPGAVICLFLGYLLDAKGDAGLHAAAVDFPIGLGCLLLAIPAVSGAQIAASWIHHTIMETQPEPISHMALKTLAGNPHDLWVWVSISSAVLLSPLFEEYLYRGFVQSALVRFGGSPGIAIVCTSAIFTSMHWGVITTWYGLVPIFMLSLAVGIAFERTKRIGVPIVMHMVFNAMNVALVALAK